MKFGKTLAVRLKPALREHCINYKMLKGMLRAAAEELRIAAGRRKRPRDLKVLSEKAAAGAASGSVGTPEAVTAPSAKRSRGTLDGDAAAASKAEPAVEKQASTPTPADTARVIAAARRVRTDFCTAVTSQANRATRWYEGVVRIMHSKAEMLGREAAALSDEVAAETTGPDADSTQAIAVPTRLIPMVSKLQTSALDLADEIADVRDFAQLCIVAVDKIGKKFDKRIRRQALAREIKAAKGAAAAASPGLAPIFPEVRAELNAHARELLISDTSPLDALQAEVDAVLRTYAAPKRRRPKTPAVVETAIKTVQRLDLDTLPLGAVSRLYIALGTDPLSLPVAVPVMVAKGRRAGPTLGITSALHGNELNGMPLIHRLFEEMDCEDLAGTIVAVIVANPHGYVRCQRGGPENTDLNRAMPGRRDGTAAQQFAHALLQRVIAAGDMDYLLDLHTASFGRVNSLYVRADLTDPSVFRLALLQHPQIIVHNRGKDGTLRGAASDLGIHTLTVEIGNPQRFHRPFIERALAGVYRTMRHLRMLPAVADDVTERIERFNFKAHDKQMTLITSTATSASEGGAAPAASSSSSSSSSLGSPAVSMAPRLPNGPVVTDTAAASRGLTALRPSSVAPLGNPSTAGIMAATMLAHAAAPARVAAAMDPSGLVRGLPDAHGDSTITAVVDARASSASSASSVGRPPARMPALTPGHPLSADPGAWRDPVICSRSFWIFTRTGGVLYVVPPVYSWVRKGDVIADVRSVFGHCVQRYFAPCDGIVIGRSDNPVCQSGDRVVHLGIAGGSLDEATDDGHP